MFRIRRARRADFGDIASIDSACFPAEELRVLDSSDAAWWVATRDDEVVGFAGAIPWVYKGESALYLYRCGVVRSARGHGLQRRLIRARVRHAREEGLDEVWTYTSYMNARSSNNLIRCGFELWLPGTWGGVDPFRLDDNAFIYWRRQTRR